MNEWVWSNGGMILTGENWSTGIKISHSASLSKRNPHTSTRDVNQSSADNDRQLTKVCSAIILLCTLIRKKDTCISSLNIAALNDVMTGLTRYLIKWMFKRCLVYIHTYTLRCNAFYRNDPPLAQCCQQNTLSTKQKGKKHLRANKLRITFTVRRIH
jgi:hypothetical protein